MSLLNILNTKLDRFNWKDGDWGHSLCPFHRETRPSFTVNMHSGWFHCFGCEESGPLQILLRQLGMAHSEIDPLLQGLQQYQKPKQEGTRFLPEYILAAYEQCPTYLLKNGFSKQALFRHQIGFDEYLMKITFPLRDIEGRLVAVSGRTIGEDQPRYKFYKYQEEFPEYILDPSPHLWAGDRVMAKIKAGGKIPYLIVCEGFKAALWLRQHGYDAVALMGTRISSGQLKLLTLFYKPVILFLDNDQAGRLGTTRWGYELNRGLPTVKVAQYPENVKQPDELSETSLRESIDEAKEVLAWMTSTDLVWAKRKGAFRPGCRPKSGWRAKGIGS